MARADASTPAEKVDALFAIAARLDGFERATLKHYAERRATGTVPRGGVDKLLPKRSYTWRLLTFMDPDKAFGLVDVLPLAPESPLDRTRRVLGTLFRFGMVASDGARMWRARYWLTAKGRAWRAELISRYRCGGYVMSEQTVLARAKKYDRTIDDVMGDAWALDDKREAAAQIQATRSAWAKRSRDALAAQRRERKAAKRVKDS